MYLTLSTCNITYFLQNRFLKVQTARFLNVFQQKNLQTTTRKSLITLAIVKPIRFPTKQSFSTGQTRHFDTHKYCVQILLLLLKLCEFGRSLKTTTFNSANAKFQIVRALSSHSKLRGFYIRFKHTSTRPWQDERACFISSECIGILD